MGSTTKDRRRNFKKMYSDVPTIITNIPYIKENTKMFEALNEHGVLGNTYPLVHPHIEHKETFMWFGKGSEKCIPHEFKYFLHTKCGYKKGNCVCYTTL